MKSLIVGCSSTHGSDTASPVYNPENTKYSWANILSKKLGYEPDNRAIPGNSNEAIFHLAMEKVKDYDLLIVGWTGFARESWNCQGQNYFFTPNWACCVEDLTLKDIYVDEQSTKTVVSDSEYMLEILDRQHRFLVTHKFDAEELSKKVENYRQSLKMYCQHHDIKYIEASIGEPRIPDITFFTKKQGHPSIEEHQNFADTMMSYCSDPKHNL